MDLTFQPDPDSDRITTCGKEILLDGRHLADAVSPEAARVIGILLAHGIIHCRADPAYTRELQNFFS